MSDADNAHPPDDDAVSSLGDGEAAAAEGDDESTDAAPPTGPQPQAAPPAKLSAHVRCFVGVQFPIITTRRISDDIQALKGPVGAAGLTVKWVPPPNLHLTLRFLGPVRREAVEAIERRLAAGLASVKPFELEARGIGAFPSPAEPRVLWVAVRPVGDEAALVALQQSVEEWLGELGFPREERPFRPHVTIGRVTAGAADLSALVAERGGRGYGTGRVGEVIVFESRTLSKGSEYHPLGRAPLLGGARVLRSSNG